MSGIKHDGADGIGPVKPRWDLIPFASLSAVVDVLTYGAEQYGANNWRELSDWRARYFAAAMRHLVKWRRGEVLDPDSGLPHLAHAACSLMFLAELDRAEKERTP